MLLRNTAMRTILLRILYYIFPMISSTLKIFRLADPNLQGGKFSRWRSSLLQAIDAPRNARKLQGPAVAVAREDIVFAIECFGLLLKKAAVEGDIARLAGRIQRDEDCFRPHPPAVDEGQFARFGVERLE